MVHRSDFLDSEPGFRGSANFPAENQNFLKLRPNVLSIPSNFIFRFGSFKVHIQTKNAFLKNDKLNHVLSIHREISSHLYHSYITRSYALDHTLSNALSTMVIRPIEKIEQAFKVAHKNEKSKNPNLNPKKLHQSLNKNSHKFLWFFSIISITASPIERKNFID